MKTMRKYQLNLFSTYSLAFAMKNGFFTAKAARPDVHRAADFLLRMVVSGRLTLCMKPPGYHLSKGMSSMLPTYAVSFQDHLIHGP